MIFRSLMLLLAALCTFCPGCPKDVGPSTDSISTACLASDFEEGYRLMDEVAQAGKEVPNEVLAACLDGNIDQVLESEKWDVIQTRLDRTRQLMDGETHEPLVVAMARAEAVLGWTELTGKACCYEDGAHRFNNLADQEIGSAATTAVDEWFTRAVAECLAEGEMVITLNGRLLAVNELYEVLPRDGYSGRLDQPVVLANILLLAEDRSEPKRRSGDRLAADLTSEDADLATLRLLLARRPGAHEATSAAIVWDETARAMVEAIHPGTLHTCEGEGVEVKQGEQTSAMLVLTSCRAETERTHDLFNRRYCDVCGTRDEREVCNTGHGRNDGQALVNAKDPICEELLRDGEGKEECQKHVRFTRTCGSNEETDKSPPMEPREAAAGDTAKSEPKAAPAAE